MGLRSVTNYFTHTFVIVGKNYTLETFNSDAYDADNRRSLYNYSLKITILFTGITNHLLIEHIEDLYGIHVLGGPDIIQLKEMSLILIVQKQIL